MRFHQILAALFLCFTITACNGCKTGEGGKPPVDWPALVECGPSASELVGVVTEIIYAGKGVKEALTDIARDEGPSTVVCIVEQLRRDWTSSTASMTAQRRAAINTADQFLKDVGTDAQWSGDSGSPSGQ